MTDAEDPVRRDRLQFELDLVEEGERALGADEKPRHVVAGIVNAVDVVAADPPQHFWKAAFDFLGLTAMQGSHPPDKLAVALRRCVVVEIAKHLAEPGPG